ARPRFGSARREARLGRIARFPPCPGGATPPPLRARVQLRCRAGAGAAWQGRNPAGGNLWPAPFAPPGFTRRARCKGCPVMETPDDLVRAVEATLFAAEEPMSAEALTTHLGGADVRSALRELEEHYRDRGVRLVYRGGRWQFQTAPDLAHLLRREREQ